MLPMKNNGRREQPVAALDERPSPPPHVTPIEHEDASSFFLMPVKSAIAPRIGDTDGDERDRDRGDRGEPRRRLRRLETGGRVGGIERRENRRDDGGEVGGVGPVVPGPGALLGRDEADAARARAITREEYCHRDAAARITVTKSTNAATCVAAFISRIVCERNSSVSFCVSVAVRDVSAGCGPSR